MPPLYPPLTVWLLRTLVRCPRVREPGRGPPPDPALLASVGVVGGSKLSPAALQKKLAARLARVERGGMDRSAPVFQNVETLAKMFGLDALEQELITLIAHIEQDELLAELVGRAGSPSASEPASVLAAATGMDLAKIRAALRSRSPLVRSGLVQLTQPHFRPQPVKLMDGVAESLLREHASAADLARHFFRHDAPATLRLADFEHMSADVSLLRQLLGAALKRRRRGVNVLLYGAPGTGKTELARAVAADLGVQLHAVNDEDEDGDSLEGNSRLRACGLAQRVLERSPRALLLFDEVEDVFPRRANALFGATTESTSYKAWTHRLLEENAVPTVWITNAVDHMDRATLRRFAVAIELRSPPEATRRRLLASRLSARLSERCIDRYARDERVTLAHIDRATAVVRLIGVRSAEKTEALLSRVVDSNVAVSGNPRSVATPRPGVGRYDLRFVNAEVDLERLVTSLAKAPSASICLHGLPGTGKTAFVSYVAERLGRQLRVERASDLLRPFLGETEQLIARMFARARQEGSVLLLDEADSFLRDRTQAVHSWELSQTNEMLVQMEAHEGIFFCATNLVERLDAASLRRFGLKIELRTMTPEQRWAMFEQLTGAAEAEAEASARRELEQLHALTPGDFAAAMRRLALMNDGVRAGELLAALRDECAMKRGGHGGRIGFARSTPHVVEGRRHQ